MVLKWKTKSLIMDTFVDNMKVQERSFVWKIPNFPVIEKRDKWINSRTADLQIGNKTWRFNLSTLDHRKDDKDKKEGEDDKGNWIGIYCKLLKEGSLRPDLGKEEKLEHLAQVTFHINFHQTYYCKNCDTRLNDCESCAICDAKPKPTFKFKEMPYFSSNFVKSSELSFLDKTSNNGSGTTKASSSTATTLFGDPALRVFPTTPSVSSSSPQASSSTSTPPLTFGKLALTDCNKAKREKLQAKSNANGDKKFTVEALTIEELKNGIGVPKLVERKSIYSYLDVASSLNIRCTIKLFSISEEPALLQELGVFLESFHISSTAKSQEDFKKLRESGVPCKEVKIITADGKEFVEPWGILAARSPHFERMYNSNMTEKVNGCIKLDDISGKAFEVLLNFIFTGTLPPSWKNDDIIIDLTNAAAKYELTDLLAFLDGVLGKVCNTRNAVQLLSLASKLDLRHGMSGILKWIKENGIESAESFLQMLEPVVAVNGSLNETAQIVDE